MKLTSKPLVTCLCICIASGLMALASQIHYKQFRDEQQQQAILLQVLNERSHQLMIEARSLTEDSGSLPTIKSYHDRNIVNFQNIVNGSIKSELSPLDDLVDVDLSALSTSFDEYSSLVSNLIQSRSKLSQLFDNKEEMLLGARGLAEKAVNLAQSIVQYGGGREQIAACYETALILSNHYMNVYQVFEQGAHYSKLDLKSLRDTLSAVTSGNQASDSAILRRSTSNLLNNIETYINNSAAITDHEQLARSLGDQVAQLSQAQRQLEEAIDPVSEILLASGNLYFLFITIAWISSLAAAICCVLIILRQTNETISPPRQQPEPASEVTGSFYLNQIKSEKNSLLNDIRPLADGILYIKADEHHESTGDLARCFNNGRKALIERIEVLRHTVDNLQETIANTQSTDYRAIDLNIDTSPLENLTFKAQAELEGIARRLKTQSVDVNDGRKLILAQCLRADNILDELRVRVRKGWQEIALSSDMLNTEANQDHQTKLKHLVDQLTEYLNEFQTQPPAKRTKRVAK